jgi:hypothetical protein
MRSKVLILSATFAALGAASCSGRPTNPPPLVQGVENNSDSSDDTLLRRRVLARFPLNGPEHGMAAYFEAHGFKVRRITYSGDSGADIYGEAVPHWGRGALVHRRATVSWRATPDGRLFEVETLVTNDGLLAGLSDL